MAAKQLILCDTNIFINLFRGKENIKEALKKIGKENTALSIVTYAEIIYGTKKNDLQKIKDFFEQYTIIDIDKNISTIFKGVVLNYSFNHHIKIPDALIAATAINDGMPLYTENKKDFDFIPEIRFHK
jgi:tRNA(fMet)-specific endonuclease VapC